LLIEKELHNLLYHPTGISSPEHNASNLDLYFLATSGPLTMPANSFAGIELHNPIGSNKQVHIAQIIDGATPNTSFTLIRNGTFAGGTLIPSYNANFSSSHSSGLTVKMISQSSDPFSGALPFLTFIQSSGSIVIDLNGRIILPPNSSLGIRIANNTPQPNLVGVTISWWEQKVLK
jgi:hypothetical protein